MKKVRAIIGGLALLALSGCGNVHEEYRTTIKTEEETISYRDSFFLSQAVLTVKHKNGTTVTYTDGYYGSINGVVDKIEICKKADEKFVSTESYSIRNKAYAPIFEEAQKKFDNYKALLKEAKLNGAIGSIKGN